MVNIYLSKSSAVESYLGFTLTDTFLRIHIAATAATPRVHRACAAITRRWRMSVRQTPTRGCCTKPWSPHPGPPPLFHRARQHQQRRVQRETDASRTYLRALQCRDLHSTRHARYPQAVVYLCLQPISFQIPICLAQPHATRHQHQTASRHQTMILMLCTQT